MPITEYGKALTILFLALLLFSPITQAQFLKKIAKKIENKPESNSNEPALKINAYAYTTQSGALKIPSPASEYLWFKTGSKFYYKDFVAEPAQSFQLEYTVKNVYNVNNMAVSEIEIKTSTNNIRVDNGSEYIKYKCSEDSLFLDYTFELKKSLLKMNPALSVNDLADMGFMGIPNNKVVGQTLPDLHFSKESGLNDGVILTTSLTNRKIEGKEKVTTPAGTFDCIKLSATRINATIKNGISKSTFSGIENIWLAPKIGLLKQESYVKGKLTNIIYLISFK